MLSERAYDFSTSAPPPAHHDYVWRYQHVNTNLSYGTSIKLNFPKAPRYYDLSSLIFRIDCRILGGDGKELKPECKAFLKSDGVGGLFERVSVNLNGVNVSTEDRFSHLTHLYNLISYRRSTKNADLQLLSKMWTLETDSANVVSATFTDLIKAASGSKTIRLDGSLSPFILSSTQLLPTQTEVQIDLDRAADRLVIGCEKDQNQPPILEIVSVRAGMKAWTLTQPICRSIETQLTQGGLMAFNSWRSTTRTIPEHVSSLTWANVYNSQTLPNICFLALLRDKTFLGSYDTLPTFYEHADVRTVTFLVNQVPINLYGTYNCNFTRMAIPMDTEDETSPPPEEVDRNGVAVQNRPFVDEGACRDSFYALLHLLGVTEGVNAASPMGYQNYLAGNVFYAVEMPSAFGAYRSTDTFSVQLEFNSPLKTPYTAILFGKDTAHVSIDADRVYQCLPR